MRDVWLDSSHESRVQSRDTRYVMLMVFKQLLNAVDASLSSTLQIYMTRLLSAAQVLYFT